MGNIRFNTNKKTTIVLLFILFLIVGGSGGYLLWRTNQEKTVAPTESEAGGCNNPKESDNCGPVKKCPDGSSPEVIYNCGFCLNVTNCGSTCNGYGCGKYCFNPYCGEEACAQVKEDEKPKCGDGKINQPTEQCDGEGTACTTPDGHAGKCSSTCTCTADPYCGDGIKNGNEQCDGKGTACTTPDGHAGKCSSTCTCTADPYCGDGIKNGNEQCDGEGTACTTTEGIAGVCSKSCTCTANPYCGDGKLDSGEKCEQGNPAGVSCTWDKCNQSACTCLPAGLVILKSGIEQCINEGTTSVSSTITYTISIKNNGEGDGKITKVEDTLDNKVVSSNLTPKDISDGGKYSNGKITWTFASPLVAEAGKEKLLTYKLDVNKENFGVYNNSVVVFPEVGPATQPVTAQVTVDCKANEPVPDVPVQPQTGLFDDSRNIVIMGAILLFVGLGWSWITESLITVRGKMLENNRSRFEKRISKR